MRGGALSSIISIIVIALLSTSIFLFVTCSYVSDYWSKRDEFISEESNMHIGSGLDLSAKEQLVNDHLLKLKQSEYEIGIKNQSMFLPAQNFLQVQPLIEQSPVFKFIEKMPKGAVLHAHDSAMVSENFVYNLTYMDHLYFCNTSAGLIRFLFANETPTDDPSSVRFRKQIFGENFKCNWKLLEQERRDLTRTMDLVKLNDYIRSKLTMRVSDPNKVYLNGDLAWDKFKDIFSTVIPLISYKPVLEKYFYQAFLENYEDNVIYIEYRGTLPPAYDLNQKIYDEISVAGFYNKILKQFQTDFPKFHGVRYIYAPYRRATNQTIDTYLEIFKKLTKTYPDFIAGFDLVGQEDLGNPLTDFVNKLLRFPTDSKFFFHAGETNWQGMTDMNLIDAILLGAYRIGHGYALDKHPLVLRNIKEEKLGIEVCPISNQVLGLVKDLRNHPAAGLLAQNYPIVISSDDPGFWGAKGLSYDFYEAFMGLLPKSAGLGALKQLVLNSISYSAMPIEEQGRALRKMQLQWNKFIDLMLLDPEFIAMNEIP